MQAVKSGQDESRFHVLQEPLPLSPDSPFVGNETLDDNLAESAQVAAWTAIQGRCDGLAVSSAAGCVTLSGTVPSRPDAERCEASVLAVPGVLKVINNLAWSPAVDLAKPV